MGMPRTHTRGFTVVEVFMVITLLAIVVGLMVAPIHRIMDSLHTRPLEEVVLSVVRDAHLQARQRKESVVLGYQAASNCLQLCTRDGILLKNFALELPPDVDEGTPMLVFYRLLPEDPEADEAAYEAEDEPVESIIFHSSGASTPFSATLMDRKNTVRLVLDPFSSEPVLREEEGHEI